VQKNISNWPHFIIFFAQIFDKRDELHIHIKMSTATEYKIYCTTENQYVSGWGTAPPTVCYNNNAHTVNANSVQVIQVISSDQVTVKQSTVITNKNTRLETVKFTDVAVDATQTQTYTFLYPSNLYSFTFAVDDTNKGDEITIVFNENETMGLITQNAGIGDTVINAPAALLLYGNVGYNLTLTDGVNTDDLGLILAIDTNADTVTVQNATTHAFLASNTSAKMSYFVMKNMTLSNAGVYKWFDEIISAAAPAVDSVITFRYKNNGIFRAIDDTPANFVIYMSLQF
jgi:hypothetical protein